MKLFAGIDSCEAGWVCVNLYESSSNLNIEIEIKANITEVWNHFEKAGCLELALIDIPIGLPSLGSKRCCDEEGKEIVGLMKKSIFNAPSEEEVSFWESFDENNKPNFKTFRKAIQEKHGNTNVNNTQAYCIVPKISELRRFLQTNSNARSYIHESHPEVCFAYLGSRQLFEPKSKFFGMLDRIEILFNTEKELRNVSECLFREYKKTNTDDVLDATALAVMARKINSNRVVSFLPLGKDTPPSDSNQFEMKYCVTGTPPIYQKKGSRKTTKVRNEEKKNRNGYICELLEKYNLRTR